MKTISTIQKVILCLSLISASGCQTLKEQYGNRSSEIKEYCLSVAKDAGYKEKHPKSLMFKCIAQAEDREQIGQRLSGIGLAIIGIYVWLVFPFLRPQ